MNEKEMAPKLPDKFSECYFESKTVPKMAKCVCALLNGDFEKKIEEIGRRPSKRLEKYGKKSKMNWIGQFKMENGKRHKNGKIFN
jgi:hypothetical protein